LGDFLDLIFESRGGFSDVELLVESGGCLETVFGDGGNKFREIFGLLNDGLEILHHVFLFDLTPLKIFFLLLFF